MIDAGELRGPGGRGAEFYYHVTAAANLDSIRNVRGLLPTETLLTDGGRANLVTELRPLDVELMRDSFQVVVRNQQALKLEALELEAGQDLSDYLRLLNARVFFWPGSGNSPNPDGTRMFARRGAHPQAMIRVRGDALVGANVPDCAYVSTCNSGASWIEQGSKSRRGPGTFVRMSQFSGDAQAVVEVSFAGRVLLPPDAQVSIEGSEQWNDLFR